MPSILSKVSEAKDSLRAIPSATMSLIVMTFFSSSRRKFGNPDWIVVFTVGLHCLQNHNAPSVSFITSICCFVSPTQLPWDHFSQESQKIAGSFPIVLGQLMHILVLLIFFLLRSLIVWLFNEGTY